MSPLHRLRLGVALALLTDCGKPAPQQPTPEAQPAESLPPIKPIIDSVRHPPPRVIIPADTTPTPPPPPPLIRAALPVRLAMTGDINLGTSTQPKGVPADSGRSTFSKVDSLLVGDLVVGNFEGMFADSGVSKKCGVPDTAGVAFRADSGRAPAPDTTKKKAPKRICYAFATPSYLAPRLKEAGFTHLNLANNHANDFGHEARVQSDSILHSLPITTYGPLGQIAIDTLRQGDRATIVGLLGFTTYPWAYDLLDLEAGIPVVNAFEGKGRVKGSELPTGRTLMTWHSGPYDQLPSAHETLRQHAAQQKLVPRAGIWECYWTDPGMVPDPAKWKTQLFLPVE